MKLFAKIYGEVVYIMTLAILLFSALFMVPRLFGITPYIVQSGSMEPLIQTGAVAFIDERNTSNVSVGDIVTFEIGNEDTTVLVTHRVVKRNSDGTLTTTGDANDAIDIISITPNQIVGKYVMSIPKVGYLLSGMNRPKLFVIAGFIVLLNISSRIMDIIVEDEEEEVHRKRRKKKRQIPAEV